MSIEVKFFARLREHFGRESITLAHANTVAEAWTLATDTQVPTERVLVAVNLHYADFATTLQPGDEVAFFPPVTGG